MAVSSHLGNNNISYKNFEKDIIGICYKLLGTDNGVITQVNKVAFEAMTPWLHDE